MKLKFNLKNRELNLEANVEDVANKVIEKHVPRKSRYQIRQEEKRKNEELKHKHEMQETYILLGFVAVLMVILLIMTVLEKL